MSYILALDQGTTSSRAIIFNHDATILAVSQQEIPMSYPRPGWVEQDGCTIFDTQVHVAREAIKRAGITAADIQALGITNQRETTLVWDRFTGKPIYPAIVWQDRRTAEQCKIMQQQGLEALFHERTGLLLDPYFSATKLAWILDTLPGARIRAEKGELLLGTVDSWLLWKLTGGRCHQTDLTNASRTLLCNIHLGCWDTELLEIFKIPQAMLPRIVDSQGLFGMTSPEFFSRNLPIMAMIGDQQAALFGQGCTEPGASKNTYGTGCFMLTHTGQTAVQSKNRLLTTVALKSQGIVHYALEGSVFVAGSAIQWLRDGLGILSSSDDAEPVARSVEDTNGVIVVPAFTGLGAPHWDPYAQGAITGISRDTSAAHIVRATLESIALQTVDLVRAMEQDTGSPLSLLRVDGGASKNNLLLEMQANFLAIPVIRARLTETTALGAALLAGQASGYWGATNMLPFADSDGDVFTPAGDQRQTQARFEQWRLAVKRVMLHT